MMNLVSMELPMTYIVSVNVDCIRMVQEDKKQLEVAVRMDSIDEGRPLKYEHSV